jgi:uncharacterized protein YoxC
MNKIFYVLAMLTFIYVAAAVTIVGFKAQAVITEVHKQLDTMWSEIEIVRDQTYSMYTECK